MIYLRFSETETLLLRIVKYEIYFCNQIRQTSTSLLFQTKMSAHEPTSHCQVYIKNLHYLTTEDDLRTLFEKYNPYVTSFTAKIIVSTY